MITFQHTSIVFLFCNASATSIILSFDSWYYEYKATSDHVNVNLPAMALNSLCKATGLISVTAQVLHVLYTYQKTQTRVG